MAVVQASAKPDILLDTSAYSAFNRGDTRLAHFFDGKTQIIIPEIVVGELRSGFSLGSRYTENERLLQRLIDSPNVHIITLTDATTRLYAKVYTQLRKQGSMVGTNDMWIAALALEHGCLLVTLDNDFSRIPDLLIAKL